MKANVSARKQSFVDNEEGFSFILPLTLVTIVGFSALVMGAYVVGITSSSLEDTLPDNRRSGAAFEVTYFHNGTAGGTGSWRNYTLPSGCTAGELSTTGTYIDIAANQSNLNVNVTINGVNASGLVNTQIAKNTDFRALLSNFTASNISTAATFLNFSFTCNNSDNNVTVRIASDGYYVDSDWASANQNSTITLLGNVTTGFSSVIDVEIVVIIITALSMAILAIMAIGSRRTLI